MKIPKGKSTLAFQAVVERFNSNLWHFHIEIPSKVALKFINGNDRRVLCTLNHDVTFQCAIMLKGKGEYFINLNQQIRKKLNLEIGTEVSVQLQKDKSEYGLPMPEELSELLKTDEVGNRIFQSLTPGKKRAFMHMISTSKNVDIRIHKAICIVNHLKLNNGKINFRELIDSIKNSK